MGQDGKSLGPELPGEAPPSDHKNPITNILHEHEMSIAFEPSYFAFVTSALGPSMFSIV